MHHVWRGWWAGQRWEACLILFLKMPGNISLSLLLLCSRFSGQSSRSPGSPVQRGAHPHGALQGSECLKESEQMDRMILDVFLAISSFFFPALSQQTIFSTSCLQMTTCEPFVPHHPKPSDVSGGAVFAENLLIEHLFLLGRCWMFQVEMCLSPSLTFCCLTSYSVKKQHIGAIKLQQWDIKGSCVFCRIPWPHAELPFVAMLCKSQWGTQSWKTESKSTNDGSNAWHLTNGII